MRGLCKDLLTQDVLKVATKRIPFGKCSTQQLAGMAVNELGINWASVWVSAWALQICDSAILVCDNNLDMMSVFMASGGIGFLSSVLVYNGFGLQTKLTGPI